MLFNNGPTCRDVVVRVESSNAVEVKVEFVETCRRYEVAPVEAPQFRVGVTGTPVAASKGLLRAGVAGRVPIVVKLHGFVKLLAAVVFDALTRQ
jgi:hypothetical protein